MSASSACARSQNGSSEGWFQVFPVGMAIDHCAAEFELAHRAFEFVRGGNGVLHGQMCEAGVALRALCNLTRQKIVGRARLVTGGLRSTVSLQGQPPAQGEPTVCAPER